MGKMMQSLKQWLSDPFGKKDIVQKHDSLLNEITQVSRMSEPTLRKAEHRRGFPIAASVGNRRLRGDV